MSSPKQLSTPAVDFVSGSLAGVASTAISHPLELVKTRLQVDRSNHNKFGASWKTARAVVLKEGGFRGLYRGLVPNLWGNALGWALYFTLYGDLKSRLASQQKRGGALTFWEYFGASAAAGAITAACTNPIWVVKTRMLSTSLAYNGSYPSMTAGFRSILRHEGVRGFYRGFVPSLFGILHGAVQFMIYEQLRSFQSKRKRGQTGQHLSTVDYLWMSALSKVLAGAATYPYQVIRSRLQMHGAEDTYRSTRDVVVQIRAREGFLALYKGLTPNLLRVLPSTCVTFIVYESVRNRLKGDE